MTSFGPLQPFRTRYTPANALWMARLAKIVYMKLDDGSPDEKGILQALNQIGAARFDKVVGFNTSSSQACVISHDDYVAAVFRGTDELADWLDNVNVKSMPGPFGEVHRGFYEALMDVWPNMRQAIRQIREEESPRRPLWLAGHSLGGAMATIAASMLADDDEPFFGVYTFGSPRCGDKEFARVYRNDGPQQRTFRFQNNNDIVTRVPARVMGYRHVGQLVYISEDQKLVRDVGFWYRFLDTVEGVVSDVGKPGFDCTKDHDMDCYIEAIEKWGDNEPED